MVIYQQRLTLLRSPWSNLFRQISTTDGTSGMDQTQLVSALSVQAAVE